MLKDTKMKRKKERERETSTLCQCKFSACDAENKSKIEDII